MKRSFVCAVLCSGVACVQAGPVVETLDTNVTRYQVDVATITGVAYEGSTGDVYLSGNTGLNADTLFRVPNSSSAATTVGLMANGDAGSYFSDIEIDAGGTLYAMSWYHRWVYTVSTANGATSFVSAGPHRDVTAMAMIVPEPSTCAMTLAGLACGGLSLWRRRRA